MVVGIRVRKHRASENMTYQDSVVTGEDGIGCAIDSYYLNFVTLMYASSKGCQGPQRPVAACLM